MQAFTRAGTSRLAGRINPQLVSRSLTAAPLRVTSLLEACPEHSSSYGTTIRPRKFHSSSHVSVAAAVTDTTSSAPVTISGLLDEHAVKHEFRDASRFSEFSMKWNFAELKKHSDAVACGLIEKRVQPGDRVLTLLKNNAESFATLVGAAKVGAELIVPTSAENLGELISAVKPKVIITDKEYYGTNVLDTLNTLIEDLDQYSIVPLATLKYPFLRLILQTGFDRIPGTERFRHFLQYGLTPNPLPARRALLKASQPVLVTVDKDGKNPIVFSQETLLSAAESLIKSANIRLEDRVYIQSPKYPFASLALGAALSAAKGCGVIIPHDLSAPAADVGGSKYSATVFLGDAQSLANGPKDVRTFDITAILGKK